MFEWDDEKARLNRQKHGVSFGFALAVFDDPNAFDTEDRSVYYGEIRRRIVGCGKGIFLTVIYTERGERIRIISARKATRNERAEYVRNQ